MSDTFDYILLTDRNRPDDQRPRFTFRYLRAREHDKMDQHFNRSRTTTAYGELCMAIRDGLNLALVEWSNVKDNNGEPLTFSTENIDSAFTVADHVELRDELSDAMVAAHFEQKRAAFKREADEAKTTNAPSGPSDATK